MAQQDLNLSCLYSLLEGAGIVSLWRSSWNFSKGSHTWYTSRAQVTPTLIATENSTGGRITTLGRKAGVGEAIFIHVLPCIPLTV